MSGKTARTLRQQLAGYKFPKQVTTIKVPAITVPDPKAPLDHSKLKVFPAFEYTVEANHNRRITHLARSRGISIEDAVQHYAKKVGMIAKPKSRAATLASEMGISEAELKAAFKAPQS